MSQSSGIEYTKTGPVAPGTEAVFSSIEDAFKAAFEMDINTDKATPQGQIMSTLTALVQDKNNQMLRLANMFNPATSSGVWQDALAAIYFIERQAARSTVVQVTCTGLQGVVIEGRDTSSNPARVRTTDGLELVCEQGGTIPKEGKITLPFVVEEPGPVQIEAHSVSRISEAQPGWDTVDNEAAGEPGVAEESQYAFERRRFNSVALNSRAMIQSVYARVANVPGVIDVLARQNRGDVEIEDNGVTLSPHSVYIAVLGGSDEDIAEAMYNTVSGGCDYNGNTTVTVLDKVTGAQDKVKFTRPREVPIAVEVVVDRTADTPSDIETLARENIYADFYGEEYANPDSGVAHNTRTERLHIGATMYSSRFYCPVISAGATQVVSIRIGRKGSALGNVVELTNEEYGSLSTEDVAVKVQGDD